MVGHSQDYHPIVNLEVSLISSMPFLAKREALFPYDTSTSETNKVIIKEVCKDVRVEPQLHQLTCEYLQHSAAVANKVRLDISARVFWQASQMENLDVRVFNPNAKRNANIELSKAYEIREKEKKKTYNERRAHSSGRAWKFHTSGNVGDKRNEP